jgi:hypothetical protein
MILKLLTDEFANRFQYEKRAQVCLWFDERAEFARLVPLLQNYLKEQTRPPFTLLAYDPEQHHGQIWLKHQIYKHLQALSAKKQSAARFVIYLPLSEDRLTSPDADGNHQLEFFAEYRYAGLIWRVGGKRPTLFNFLRQSGFSLPDNPAEQRRLYDGGSESLLAKYVAKFADRPPAFWETSITPELVQTRLVGDVEQTVLDLAIAPDATWKRLKDNGLLKEFTEVVRERFGFQTNTREPRRWVAEFVAVLALTETYAGYGEPPDFPFADRLPPLPVREHHTQFLRRWLRDAESRPAWDRWVAEVEGDVDLSRWAANREGLSFGLPHLVRLRWERTLAEFEAAAGKTSETLAFFGAHGARIAKEVEFAKASHAETGAWWLLARLGKFIRECEDGLHRAKNTDGVSSLAALYAELAPRIEREHLGIRFDAMNQSLPTAARVADRHYAAYAVTLNSRFFDVYRQQAAPEIVGIEFVTERLRQKVWNARGKRAVIIVDALRLDCAHAIKDLIPGGEVSVEPVRAALPTITPVGMTALLPLDEHEPLVLEVQGAQIHLRHKGKDLAARSNRLALLSGAGADCRDISEIEDASTLPEGIGELLVVFGHEEVDSIGHGNANNLIRHLDREVERLARVIRKVHAWGYPTVHVVTDHGFILIDEDKLPPEVECKKEWCRYLKERFAFVPAEADIPVATFPFHWDERLRVAVPPGMAFFKAEKSFSHGGATLQELITPHLVSSIAPQVRRIGVDVTLPTFELLQASLKVVLHPRSALPESGALDRAVPQMGFDFSQEQGRLLLLDVQRGGESLLPDSQPKEVRLEPQDVEKRVTLFFRTELSFTKGEFLDFIVKDADTDELLSPPGMKLTVARDM